MKKPLQNLIGILCILLAFTVLISCESLEPTITETLEEPQQSIALETQEATQEVQPEEPEVVIQEELVPVTEEQLPTEPIIEAVIEPAIEISEELPQVESPEASEKTTATEEEAVVIPTTPEGTTSHLYILHTNDTHGRVEESDESIGFAKISTIIDMYEERVDNVLVLDAGDALHGTPIATLVEGESIASIMNLMGYDAMVAGNNDFNYGIEQLLNLDDVTDFPILSANTIDTHAERILPPYKIFTFEEFSVGVFGLTSRESSLKIDPTITETLTFEDTVESAQALVEELSPQVDIIIALTHLGIDSHSSDTSSRIAEEVPGIDLIIDGFSHTTLPVGLRVNDTLIVQTGSFTQNLGAVEITLKNGSLVDISAKLYSKEDVMNQEIPDDPDLLTLIDEKITDQEIIKSQVIAYTESILDGEPQQVMTRPTNLSRLITAAMNEATGADCSILTGSRISSSIDLGEITIGEVLSALPFGDACVVIELTGQELYDTVEYGLSKAPESNEAYCQLGNLVALYNVFEEPGNRVYKLKIDGETIDKELVYRVATSDFLASGGDGYAMFEDKRLQQEIGSIADITIDFMKRFLIRE